MLKPMSIAGDDRRFIAVYVISMIAVTARTVTDVLVVVAVGFTRGVVVMDVRMVSSTMAMIEGAHYIDLIRAN
jgi:deoxyribose-phosphate aldolase